MGKSHTKNPSVLTFSHNTATIHTDRHAHNPSDKPNRLHGRLKTVLLRRHLSINSLKIFHVSAARYLPDHAKLESLSRRMLHFITASHRTAPTSRSQSVVLQNRAYYL